MQPLFTQKRGFGKTSIPFTSPWYKGETHYGSGLPNSEQLPNDLVRLSMSPTLQEEDIHDMAAAVRKVAEAYCQV
jgi:dTDP-4-amino-4,6-dideoxygalactose transaminase